MSIKSIKSRKQAAYIIPFLVSFLFIVFVHSLNFNTNPAPLRSEKENAIFLNEVKPSENYISMRMNNRIRVTDIFSGKDTLPNFVHSTENYIVFDKTVKLTRKIVKESIFSTIIERYRERILLIWYNFIFLLTLQLNKNYTRRTVNEKIIRGNWCRFNYC